MVGHTQRQAEQADDRTDQPLGLPVELSHEWGRNILDQERFKLKQPQVVYSACFSAFALGQIEAKLLLAGI
jgi:hypothetical protein